MNKLYIICAKCGSNRINIRIPREVCPDNPQAVAHFICEDCGELTGVNEWAEHNDRRLIDMRTHA
ncbi:hypothetical protein AB7124_004969 [Pseudomonas aeruginosa]